MKSQSYMTRAMRAQDPRFARILGKLGYGTKVVVAEPVEPEDDLDVLRAEAESLGVDVDGRWGEKRLKQEIGKAKKAD